MALTQGWVPAEVNHGVDEEGDPILGRVRFTHYKHVLLVRGNRKQAVGAENPQQSFHFTHTSLVLFFQFNYHRYSYDRLGKKIYFFT